MGSKKFEREEIVSFEDVPKVPLRLNKIHGLMDGLGNKGFHASHGDYSNNNGVHTPDLASNLNIYQCHENEVPRKSKLCILRWTSESANYQLVKLAMLKDVAPYEFFLRNVM